ncbi:MAG: lysostaphin resistance A-like protein, partial [Flavobacteriaceae bacterium]
SALPLIGIILVFWLIQKQSRKEIGLVPGKIGHYGLALMYPVLVLGTTALIAYLYGDFAVREIDLKKDMLNLVLEIILGPVVLILTEEGFFRGWLWGSFRKTGMTPKRTLFVTSVLFVIWHISAVTSGTEYGLPLTQVPVYLVNGTLLGLIWGTLRWASGSIIVAALSHAVWNALAYLLFGYGEKIGLLGVTDTFLLGPEVGYLGIILNGLFFLWLWKKTQRMRLLAA